MALPFEFTESMAFDAVDSQRLQGRAVIVTGAAHGLGLAMASAFVGAGARVGMVDVDREGLKTAIETLSTRGEVHARQIDVRDTAAMRVSVDDLARALGGIDIIVNDAGVTPSSTIAEQDLEQFSDLLDLNVVGYVRAIQSSLPYLLESAHARIINIGSVTFFLGEPDGLTAYIATKGAIVGLTRALARELGPRGITANVLAPGAFPTRAEHGLYEDQAAFDRSVIEKQCIKRRGSVSDIAAAALFLASDAASFITGQTLLVDGGWTFN